MKRLLRLREVCQRLGISKSTLYKRYIRPGKLKLYPLGARNVVAVESDVDRLVAEITAAPSDYSGSVHARRRVGVRKLEVNAWAVPKR
jgi:predicted DNA-binding transcriptional regulator AlpA